MTRIAKEEVMGSPPKQCASSFHIVCQEVSSQVKYLSARSHVLFSGFISCNFYRVFKVKSTLKGMRFKSIEDVKEKTVRLLKELTKKISSTVSNNRRFSWSIIGIEEGFIFKVIICKSI